MTGETYQLTGIKPSHNVYVGAKLQITGRAGFVQILSIDTENNTAEVQDCTPPGANRRERRANERAARVAARGKAK